jgi:hypothetical protein
MKQIRLGRLELIPKLSDSLQGQLKLCFHNTPLWSMMCHLEAPLKSTLHWQVGHEIELQLFNKLITF